MELLSLNSMLSRVRPGESAVPVVVNAEVVNAVARVLYSRKFCIETSAAVTGMLDATAVNVRVGRRLPEPKPMTATPAVARVTSVAAAMVSV